MYKHLVAFLFIAVASCTAQESDSKLISSGMQHVGECAMESNVKFENCLEMFDKDAKHDDAKYDTCKCMIPCVAKKMKTMNAEGKFQEAEILKIVNDLKTPGFKEEGLKVYELCKTVEGVNCEAGFNMVKCILTNSEKARNIVMAMVQTMKGKTLPTSR